MEYKNLSATLFGNMDCMRKVEYYLDRTPQFSQGGAAPWERGVRLHKELERYFQDELYVPGFTCFEREDERAFWRVASELDRVRHLVTDSESEFVKVDGELVVKGIIDLIIDHNGRITIVDYKFPGKKWNDAKFASYLSQAFMYLWFLEPNIHALEFWVCPMNDPDDFQVWHVAYEPHVIQQNLQVWRSADQQIRSAVMFPVMFQPEPAIQRCSWCNWRHLCDVAAVRGKP